MAEIPQNWKKAMVKANIGDPRNGQPSMRALALAADESPETVRRMVIGVGNPSPTSVAKVADALGIDPRTVAKWVGQHRAARKTFVPHENADLLNEAERAAINRLIALMTEGRRGALV